MNVSPAFSCCNKHLTKAEKRQAAPRRQLLSAAGHRLDFAAC